jgi:hypothetical protein
MNVTLEREVDKVLQEAAEAKCHIVANPSEGGDSAIIANEGRNTAVIIGVLSVDISNQNVSKKLQEFCVAYSINLPKCVWANTEGFSLEQMVDEMGEEIFKKIDLHEVLPALCE